MSTSALGKRRAPTASPQSAMDAAITSPRVLAVEDGVALRVAEQRRRARAGPGGRRGGRCRPRCAGCRCGATSSTRRSISRAALLVKVSSSIASGSRPAVEQPGHAPGERAGLAGAGAGDDEERAVGRLDDRLLLVVELAAGVEGAGRAGGGSQLVAARHRTRKRSTAVRQIRYRAPAREVDGGPAWIAWPAWRHHARSSCWPWRSVRSPAHPARRAANRRPLPPPAGDGRAGARDEHAAPARLSLPGRRLPRRS